MKTIYMRELPIYKSQLSLNPDKQIVKQEDDQVVSMVIFNYFQNAKYPQIY